MFDCNRINWKNDKLNVFKTSEEQKKEKFIYTYSAMSGKPTKSFKSSELYINHIQKQVENTGLILPSALAHLNRHGSINCVHNIKKPVLAQYITKCLDLPVLNAFYGEEQILPMIVPE